MTSNGSTKVPVQLESLDGKGSQGGKPDEESVALSPRLLSYKSASRYLSVGYTTVRHMVLSGTVPHIKSGRRILIDIRDLDAWISKSKEWGV